MATVTNTTIHTAVLINGASEIGVSPRASAVAAIVIGHGVMLTSHDGSKCRGSWEPKTTAIGIAITSPLELNSVPVKKVRLRKNIN